MAWITTPLNAGPIPGIVNYDYTISSLSANTVYQYRAYMIVSGVEYFGQTCEITTLPLTPTVPILTTGAINPALSDYYSLTITGNTVTSVGTPPETEHGLVWSLSPSPTMPSTNYDTNFPNPYSITMSYLSPNTTYYARAYACNTTGYGYGNEIVVMTPALPAKEINFFCYGGGGTDGGYVSTKCLCFVSTPAMVAGECFTICLGLPLFVDQDLIPPVPDGLSCSSYELWCKNSSMTGYVLYWGVGPSFCTLYATQCSPDTISCKEFTFCYGDSIRVIQKAQTKSGSAGLGGTNSCACIKGITSLSGGGSFTIGTTCCKSCAYTG